jgi:hypothetical protein
MRERLSPREKIKPCFMLGGVFFFLSSSQRRNPLIGGFSREKERERERERGEKERKRERVSIGGEKARLSLFQTKTHLESTVVIHTDLSPLIFQFRQDLTIIRTIKM